MRTTTVNRAGILLLSIALLGSAAAVAQLNLPQASQKAKLQQTIGASDITITYHRPKVNERQIWGALVPYDQVWRAGANENTTIELSHDVKVEGEDLAAGTYGLHVIPSAEGDWTVIFSNNSSSWGSFFYDQEEDALRVEVAPKEIPHQELLTYDLIEQRADGATLVLSWEKVQVPVEIAVDTHEIVLASIRDQLRSTPSFTWTGWNQAANYCIQNELNYDEALEWVEQSIQREERFENLMTKSQLLAKTGKEAEAEAVMARAIDRGTPLNLHNYARQLVGQGEPEKAMEIFKLNGEKHPDTWFIDVGMARGYSALGQYDKAAESLRAAIPKAPEAQRPFYENMVKQLENGEAIN